MAKGILNNKKMESFESKKKDYTNLLKNEDSTDKQIEKAFDEMFNALQTDLTAQIRVEARNEYNDNQILASRNQNVLTTEEREYFNAVALSGGFNDDSILPRTTVERVFEELELRHPLLQEVGIRDLGAVVRFIDSNPNKTYAWGNLFDGITGQVSTAFTEREVTSVKLTAFAAIPNDMLEQGPEYIERYVRSLLVESFSVGLEFGLVQGNGATAKQPVGLMKDIDFSTGAVTDKTSSGTLTFAPSEFGQVVAGELHDVVSKLSTDAKGNPIDIDGKVVMVVNPTDEIAVRFRNTIQTANGTWVTALPYNIKVVSSSQVPAKKAVFFVKGRYTAYVAGDVKLRKFDQTLALEDATLYTIKQVANGEPIDNKASLVYDLNIQFTAPVAP